MTHWLGDLMKTFFFFFFKQKTAYEMRISDWSSDVCSSDLPRPRRRALGRGGQARIEKGDVEGQHRRIVGGQRTGGAERDVAPDRHLPPQPLEPARRSEAEPVEEAPVAKRDIGDHQDRKSTRLNSSP